MKEGVDYRRWASPAPKAVFLLVHGLGAHSGRWEALAAFFLEREISSYAIELRTFKESGEPEKEHIDGYYGRIQSLRDIIAEENPGKKIFLIGESLGAIISLLFIRSHPGLFDGAALISPAFKGRLNLTVIQNIRMLWTLFHDPERHIGLPFDSGMCTRDPIFRQRMDSDPREYRSVPIRFILEILSAQGRARRVKRLSLPVLFLVPGEDKIVDDGITKKIFKRLSAEDKKMVEFPGMYHSLSIELGKEAVFMAILKWVNDRCG